MKQGQILTSEEIEIVNTLIWRKPVREVAEKIGKSLLTLHYYLKNRNDYPIEKDNKQKDKYNKLSLTMANDLSQNKKFYQQQQQQQQSQEEQHLQQRISHSTMVTQQRNKYVKKLKSEVMLSVGNRQERLNFATQHVKWDEDIWKRVIFHDERKFNLDGPDGFTNYFHDMRNNEKILSNRPRGEAVYVWFAISSMGPVQCKVSSIKFTKEAHLENLEEINKSIGTKPFIMQQQNNCSLNNETIIKNWIQENKIEIQMWPNISHDINIMENIWGWLIREVYDGGKQYSRKVDLLYKIQDVWSRIPIYLIQNLYSSLPNRMIELFYTKGQYTNCS